MNALKLLNDFLVKLGAFHTGFQYLAFITLLWQVRLACQLVMTHVSCELDTHAGRCLFPRLTA